MRNDYDKFLDALVAWLRDNAVGFQQYERRLQLWTKVSSFPALFVRHTGFDIVYDGSLKKTTLSVEIWIYGESGDDEKTPPSSVLNKLIAKVLDALEPDDDENNTFTLGGLVWSCLVEGRAELDPGDLDKICKAIIPVQILLPAEDFPT